MPRPVDVVAVGDNDSGLPSYEEFDEFIKGNGQSVDVYVGPG